MVMWNLYTFAQAGFASNTKEELERSLTVNQFEEFHLTGFKRYDLQDLQ